MPCNCRYLKNYVRLHGRRPIRWCAVEVLEESRYSTASDVWAYGVTCWEIMADGETPYGECDNLVMLSERVKAGIILRRPPKCPTDVYASLLVPCWEPDPLVRPSFAELVSSAQSLGGVMSDRLAENAEKEVVSDTKDHRDRLADSVRYPPEFWKTSEGLQLLGVSVQHVSGNLRMAAVRATRVPFLTKGYYTEPPPIDQITVKDMVAAVVVPRCQGQICPRDGGSGCAYIDTLSSVDDVGPSSALLSYSWSYTMDDVAVSLDEWANSHRRDPSRTYVFPFLYTRFILWKVLLHVSSLHITLISSLIAPITTQVHMDLRAVPQPAAHHQDAVARGSRRRVWPAGDCHRQNPALARALERTRVRHACLVSV